MEVGGDGSCAWRAISIQVALQNQRGTGATLDDMMDKVEILSTSLRVKTISFLKANKDRWMPDSKSTETTEDGKPAQTGEEFLKVLDRPQRWICGLTLQACAMIQKITIVVWGWNGTDQPTHMPRMRQVLG